MNHSALNLFLRYLDWFQECGHPDYVGLDLRNYDWSKAAQKSEDLYKRMINACMIVDNEIRHELEELLTDDVTLAKEKVWS